MLLRLLIDDDDERPVGDDEAAQLAAWLDELRDGAAVELASRVRQEFTEGAREDPPAESRELHLSLADMWLIARALQERPLDRYPYLATLRGSLVGPLLEDS